MNTENILNIKTDALKRAVMYFGSQAELGRKLGVTKVAVNGWVKNRRAITAEMAVAIEKITNATVLREELRPDLFIR